MFERARFLGLPSEYECLPKLGDSPPKNEKTPKRDIFTDNFARKIADLNYASLLAAASVLKKHVFSTKGTLKLDKQNGQIYSICGPAGDVILFSEVKDEEVPLECAVTLGGYVEQKPHIIKFHYNFEILYPECEELSSMAASVLDLLDKKFKNIDETAKIKNRAFIYSMAFLKYSYPLNNIGFAMDRKLIERKHESHRMEYLRLMEYMDVSRFCKSFSTNRGKVLMIESHKSSDQERYNQPR